MVPLDKNFVENCRCEGGFYLRGEAMTRIEVFVDAAFAFAITMLVISIDKIPRSMPEFLAISKQIPAFVVCVIQILSIWHGHAVWSRRFGLEDGRTVIASALLLMIVLIYVYPLKMMFSGMFSFISNGFFPSNFKLHSYQELRYLFASYAIGFMAIALVFVWMYRFTLGMRDELHLTEGEVFHSNTECYQFMAMFGVGALALVLPFLVPDRWVSLTGFTYASLAITQPLIDKKRQKPS